jgi:spermidine synthase
MPKAEFDPSFPAITAAGFAATIVQILLLRELLVLFHGNEMSTGLVLAGWLLWTSAGSALAARLSSRFVPRRGVVVAHLAVLAVVSPALVLLVRASRWVFGIPYGELVTIGNMILIALVVPAFFCPVAGALFGLCWAYRRQGGAGSADTRPLKIYLGEALGAAAAGIVFFFVLLRLATAIEIAVGVAIPVLCVAGWILWSGRPSSLARPAGLIWLLATSVVLAAAFTTGRLEESSRRWQWGEHLAAARDTPFHNLAILRQTDQVTVFTNGLWLFTLPDPVTTELAVDVALLVHPRPRSVLLLGGGLAGHVEEALKDPGIERIDYVELDPELISFSRDYLTAGVRESLGDPRVRVHSEDAGAFVRRHAEKYDVILMSVGDPINAQMNRFYTVEFFRRIRERLLPGGILSFSVPGGGDVIGPAHAEFLGSMNRTVREVFPQVSILPGERARFIVASQPEGLELDPAVLAGRIRERGLDPVHVREDVLWDQLNPLRLDYVRSILEETDDGPVNRQFSPVCYFHGLRIWSAQWHPGLARIIGGAAAVRPAALIPWVVTVGVVAILFFWIGRPRYRLAVGASVLAQGATGMVLQVVLILTFQILEGFAYLQIALIIAFFMAGLAAGTLWTAALQLWWEDRHRVFRWLTILQVAVTVFPLAMLVFFSPVCEGLRESLSPVASSWVFSTASLTAGVLGGAHFSLAALASTAAGARLERAGGYLYAVDLAGAAGGAFAAGLFVLPLHGVTTTLILLSAISAVCLAAILRRPAVAV